MISVLIADNCELIRAGMKYAFSQTRGIKVIGETNSGKEVITLTDKLNPQIVTIDIKLLDLNGLEATKIILQNHPTIKILIITSCESTVYPMRLIEMGVSGYLNKNTSIPLLIQTIKSIHAGQQYVCLETAKKITFERAEKSEAAIFDKLSNRELQIAIFIADGKKTKFIASKLNLTVKTIYSYRYRIFKKLNISSSVELTKLALKHKVI